MEDPFFVKGDVHINFVEERIGEVLLKETLNMEEVAAVVAVLASNLEKESARAVTLKREPKAVSFWRLAGKIRGQR